MLNLAVICISFMIITTVLTVTVMFVESEYSFFEDEVHGIIEVSTSGPVINSFQVLVVGGNINYSPHSV